jgi:cytochrome b6-f complex iron-sulfur subunit
MTRRDLIQKIAIGGTTILITPMILSACTKEAANSTANNPSPGGGITPSGNLTIDLSIPAYAALNNIGGSVVVQSIIIANSGGNFIALSSVCTHQGCTVGYSASADNFPCPCHGSLFSASGSVVNGPAISPLKSYTVTRNGNILTIG